MAARDPLVPYRHKRDFTKSAEPRGGTYGPDRGRGSRFVVQKHAARTLHYDFRLEAGGVLKSWALPKGPSLDPAQKRLAVETEDHPLAYAEFEGDIAEGQYGAGRVIVWDEGTYTVSAAAAGGSVAAAYRAGKIEFTLAGRKLRGGFALVRMRRGDGKQWLFIKRRDAHADAAGDVLADRPESVRSGRSLENDPGRGKGRDA